MLEGAQMPCAPLRDAYSRVSGYPPPNTLTNLSAPNLTLHWNTREARKKTVFYSENNKAYKTKLSVGTLLPRKISLLKNDNKPEQLAVSFHYTLALTRFGSDKFRQSQMTRFVSATDNICYKTDKYHGASYMTTPLPPQPAPPQQQQA